MRLTIIPSDGTVIVDGVGFNGLDLSFMPANVHAVQWYDTYGDVEIKNGFGKMVENIEITSIEPYQQAVTAWQTKKTEIEEQLKLLTSKET